MKAVNISFVTPYLIVSIITGCGGSESTTHTDKEDNAPVVAITELPVLNQPSLSSKPLKKASRDELLNHIKNGLYWQTSKGPIYVPEALDDIAQPAGDAAVDGNFSKTITQESGVDEADRVKQDANYIYLSQNPDLSSNLENAPAQAFTKVMVKNADDSLQTVSHIELAKHQTDSNQQAYIQGLFLNNNTLAVLSKAYTYYNHLSFDIWQPVQQDFQIDIHDVQTTENPVLADSLKIEGHLLSSRVIDNQLYIVSSFQPYVENLIDYPQSDADKLKNYQDIVALNDSEILPQVTRLDRPPQNLVDTANCYLPEDTDAADGYSAIVTLSRINLTNPEQIESICINSQITGLYATTSSLFLYGTDYQANAFIHQFDIGPDNLTYIASTELDGHFGWGQSQLRFSQQNGLLRVVTTKRVNSTSDNLEHQLWILEPEPQTHQMKVVGTLPNAQNSNPIGKPNEDIYAVRFFNNKAYIVTFLRLDPLYVIDLSEPDNPQYQGELEVSGYSSYLHPLSDKLILGIGQQVDPNLFIAEPFFVDDIAESGVTDTHSTEPEDGIKIALYDVSDPASPKDLGNLYFGQGYTPAEYNYHALTYIKTAENEHRFALPIQSWQQETMNGYWRPDTRLSLISVKQNEEHIWRLSHQADVNIDSTEQHYYIGSYDDRSLINQDSVYYIHGNHIWQTNWNDPSVINGPY